MRTIASIHWYRRNARREERAWQEAFRESRDLGGVLAALNGKLAPEWANGARVEKAGRFQWAVVFTITQGH